MSEPAPVTVIRNVVIPLRDGCATRADVYLPTGPAGPWPVVLERTPYGKENDALRTTAMRFAGHGFAVVIQDVRGRGASEGTWYKARNEGEDGFDTVKWISHQAWCDGRVGTIGLSYSTCTQASLACLQPPALAAQFLAQGVGTYYRAAARHGGALEQRQIVYLFRQAATSPEARANPAIREALNRALDNAKDWLLSYPLRRGASPLALLPSYEQYLMDLQTHGTFDEWWKTPGHSPILFLDRYPDIPLFYLAGWFDHHVQMQTHTYATLRKKNSSDLRLWIGPWLHGESALKNTSAGDVEFGPEAAIDYDALRLEWYKAVIAGEPSPLLSSPPVRIFVMGSGDGSRTKNGLILHGGFWMESDEWPPAEAEETRLFLRSGGLLSPELEASLESSTTYTYNPADPVPSIGGNFGPNDQFTPGGIFDQRGAVGKFLGCTNNLPLSTRSDVLVFETDPLEEDALVIGPVEVELYIGSDCPDTDFTAKLIDVYPPSEDHPEGLALNLCDDILRARYRDGFEREAFLQPGEVYKIKIELPPTANLFKKGHRIRLDISSSNFPRFDRNPNTGEPQGTHRTTRIARNTVHHSRNAASCLKIHVMRSP